MIVHAGEVGERITSMMRVSPGLLPLLRRYHTDDTYAGGFKMSDAMVRAVAHQDGLAQPLDQRAGLFGKPSIVGLVPVRYQVVGDLALGAGERRLKPAMECAAGEFADRL